ncbi:MAG: PD-(D/E)XK nuclease-like domain-containing protein [Planctomycetia bacterium]|nr:PD-(D/E)XK nuclease-like domain-containing protein [Planctomycetia bacterium]
MTVATADIVRADHEDRAYLAHEPARVYHARSREYLSSHQLADFRKCPLLYHRRKLGLIADEERPAFLVGQAAHTLILEGRERFDAEYAVGGPINPKTNSRFGSRSKAWQEWAEAQGKPVLADDQVELVERMAESVAGHTEAQELLAEGMAEAVVRSMYCGAPCQIRMDWFDPYKGLVDLKTCDDLTWFEFDAQRFGYAYQLAFYRAVLAQLLCLPMPVHLIAVEKKEPFRCGVWKVKAEMLSVVERENMAAIARLKRCEANDYWPSGYEEIRLFDVL